MENIKELMTSYDKAQRAGSQAAIIRKQVIPLIKKANLTKTKFNFGDRNIFYHSYNDYEGITQRLIKSVIEEKYPHINSKQFISDLYTARKRKQIETLKVK